MTVSLTQTQLQELISVLDVFVMDGIDEDNKFIEVYNTLVEQVESWLLYMGVTTIPPLFFTY